MVVGTYAASSLHGGSTRVVAAKVALLPTLSGCVAGRRPSAQPAGAPRTALTVSPSSSSCVTTRPLGGPSRRSSKGGWTPEEVRHMELPVCRCGGQGPAGAAPTPASPAWTVLRHGRRLAPCCACPGRSPGWGERVLASLEIESRCPVPTPTGRRAAPGRRAAWRQRGEKDWCVTRPMAGAPARRPPARWTSGPPGRWPSSRPAGAAGTSYPPGLTPRAAHSRVFHTAVGRAVPAPLAEGAESGAGQRPLDSGGACRDTASQAASRCIGRGGARFWRPRVPAAAGRPCIRPAQPAA